MKYTLIILLLFSTTQAATKKNLKTQLIECQVLNYQLDSLVRLATTSNSCINLTYPKPTTRLDLRLHTELEETKRKLAKYELKGLKSNNNAIIKTDKFRNAINGLSNMALYSAIALIFGGGAGFLKLFQFIKDIFI